MRVLTAPLTIGPGGRIRAHAASLGQLKNAGTGLCISSRGTTSVAPAYQEYCNGSSNQYWFGEEQVGGIHLVNAAHYWCLQNQNGAAFNNNGQLMWPCSGSFATIYYWFAASNGDIKFEPVTSSLKPNHYCLSSLGVKTAGTGIAEYACNTSPNQDWIGPISVSGG